MRGRPSAAALAKAGDLDTRTRILDAAERLIAERGFHGVSLREITAAARANSAAIHYYFRRKEAASRILPSLSARDLQWRFHVLVATLIYLMAHPGRVQAVDVDAPDVYNPDDMHEALHYVVPMLVAIFQAPPAARPAVPVGAPVVLSAINEYGDR